MLRPASIGRTKASKATPRANSQQKVNNERLQRKIGLVDCEVINELNFFLFFITHSSYLDSIYKLAGPEHGVEPKDNISVVVSGDFSRAWEVCGTFQNASGREERKSNVWWLIGAMLADLCGLWLGIRSDGVEVSRFEVCYRLPCQE